MRRKETYMVPIVATVIFVIAALAILRCGKMPARVEPFQGCWTIFTGFTDSSKCNGDTVTARDEEARQRGYLYNSDFPLVCNGIATPWITWTGPVKNGLPLKCFIPGTQNGSIINPNIPKVSPPSETKPVDRAPGWQPTPEQPLDTIVIIDANGKVITSASGTTPAPTTTTTAPTTTTPTATTTTPTTTTTTSQSTTNGGKEFIKIDSNNIYTTKVVLLLVAWILAMLLFIDITILPNDILHGASKSPNPFGWFLLITTLALGVTGIFV